MKKANLMMLTLLALFVASSYASAQTEIPDNKGKEFWIMFNRQVSAGPNLDLFITGEMSTSGTVEIPGAENQTFTVTPGEITTIDVPISAYAQASDGVEDKGIRIVAESEVTVYGLNQDNATTDAFLALPTDILGTEYYVMSFTNRSSGLESLLGVVATEDNTEITITPASNAGSRVAGVPFTVTMDEGQTYQLRATGSNTNDLTGTQVSSTKPVAVFGGHICADVPKTQRACDHLIEQMPPASSFGQRFVTVPLATRTGGDLFRILASEDGTDVTVQGTEGFSLSFTLNQGEFEEIDVPSNVYAEIIATGGSILVAQFSKGTTTDGVTSDPFMMLIPPFEQFQDSYTVTTPATIFDINFINLAVPNAAVGSVTLDGSPIPASEYTQIGSSGFSAVQKSVERGTHNMTSGGLGLRFGAFMYGYANADSYGYPGGQAIGDIVGISEVNLELDQVIKQGESYTFTAVVTKEDGTPSVGATIDFMVSGANDVAGNSTTNEQGVATFTYTPLNPGIDTIKASIGNVSDETTISIEFPVLTTLTLDPSAVTVEANTEVCITATALDQFDDLVENAEIFTEIGGEVVATNSTGENGEVQYCFTPTESGVVPVTFFFQDGERVVAQVTVSDDDDEPVPTALSLAPEDATVALGEEICLTGTVLDQFGNPLSGVEVSAELSSESVEAKTTDGDGEVEYCFAFAEVGVFTLTASYEGGEPVVATIEVAEEQEDSLAVASFTLLDADADQNIRPLTDGDVVNLSELNDVLLSVRANTTPEEVGSVYLQLEGPDTHQQTENVFPYALFGDRPPGEYRGRRLPAGEYTLTATPYSLAKRQGLVGKPLTVRFSVIEGFPTVESFTLLDADADQDIRSLVDGDMVSLLDINDVLLSVRANTTPEEVGSVYLQLEGPQSHSQTENVFPYALFGDRPPGEYRGRRLPAGEYTLTATPYSLANRQGLVGKTLTVRFSIIDDRNSRTVLQQSKSAFELAGVDGHRSNFKVYPVPSDGVVHFNIPETSDERAQLLIYDALGKVVYASKKVDISALNLRSYGEGVFFVRFVSQEHTYSQRVLIQ